jgi:hypothetical protein
MHVGVLTLRGFCYTLPGSPRAAGLTFSRISRGFSVCDFMEGSLFFSAESKQR